MRGRDRLHVLLDGIDRELRAEINDSLVFRHALDAPSAIRDLTRALALHFKDRK